jgi:predicted AlkP superfamily pyrophosphatase or phosphodiesterase
MATVYQQNAVFLDDYFDFGKTERILWTGEIVQIFPKADAETEIIGNLQSRISHSKCWRKAEIPERFHYQSSPRIAPIICSADEGWVLTNHERFEETKKRADFLKPKGAHGYDNQLESMRATFIAHGAAFKKHYVAEPFENVEVYNLMCRILSLNPARNDGDFRKVKNLLR